MGVHHQTVQRCVERAVIQLSRQPVVLAWDRGRPGTVDARRDRPEGNIVMKVQLNRPSSMARLFRFKWDTLSRLKLAVWYSTLSFICNGTSANWFCCC
jgi:hypothetical protein